MKDLNTNTDLNKWVFLETLVSNINFIFIVFLSVADIKWNKMESIIQCHSKI